jgi:hypothetical protein
MSALEILNSNGTASSELIAPACFCTQKVTALETPASKKNGAFSQTSFIQGRVRRGTAPPAPGSALRHPHSANLPSGQKSSSNSTKGRVTSIGLLIRPQAKKTSART